MKVAHRYGSTGISYLRGWRKGKKDQIVVEPRNSSVKCHVLIRFWMWVCKVDHVSERLVQTWHHSSFVSVDFHHHHHTWVKDDNKECVPDFKTLQACFHIWTRHSFYCQQIVEGLRGYTPLNRAVFSLQFSLEMWQVSSYKQHSVLCNTGSLHQCGYKKEGGRVRKTSHECSPCTSLWELFLISVWNWKYPRFKLCQCLQRFPLKNTKTGEVLVSHTWSCCWLVWQVFFLTVFPPLPAFHTLLARYNQQLWGVCVCVGGGSKKGSGDVYVQETKCGLYRFEGGWGRECDCQR